VHNCKSSPFRQFDAQTFDCKRLKKNSPNSYADLCNSAFQSKNTDHSLLKQQRFGSPRPNMQCHNTQADSIIHVICFHEMALQTCSVHLVRLDTKNISSLCTCVQEMALQKCSVHLVRLDINNISCLCTRV
jgi:hypothetical protein